MPKSKSPFINLSVEQVMKAESQLFTVNFGNDLYNKDGDLVFDHKEATENYNFLLRNIKKTIINGNEKQKKMALHYLTKLKILPLRIH